MAALKRGLIFWLKRIDATDDYHLINVDKILHEMRLRKSSLELKLLRKAVEITAAGFLRAMRKCRPGMHEFELKAELLYEFTRLGGRNEAFEAIVGGGATLVCFTMEK